MHCVHKEVIILLYQKFDCSAVLLSITISG